jgi:GNAT superfamily N-acetyltransferase
LKVITPKPEHVFAWVELAKQFAKEGINGEEWGINEADLHTTYHLWDKENWGFLLECDGEIVGVLAGIVTPHFFNYDNKFFNEFMWYVKPEYRKSGGGLLLYRALVKRCRELGVKRIVMGHTRDMILEFESLYEKLGFTYLQTHYEKVL